MKADLPLGRGKKKGCGREESERHERRRQSRRVKKSGWTAGQDSTRLPPQSSGNPTGDAEGCTRLQEKKDLEGSRWASSVIVNEKEKRRSQREDRERDKEENVTRTTVGRGKRGARLPSLLEDSDRKGKGRKRNCPYGIRASELVYLTLSTGRKKKEYERQTGR